ncbi:MAG: 6,7-dimethyl-8-ribityllumazine synthase [Candidatus Angelobacter sp.]|nr:6,7-dimethyl-8-ribityllumazine synthase [Candidatus Angelobacter sp.]
MIKSITTVRLTKSAKDFEKLSALFDSLGFGRGHGWKDGHSRGAPFLAPVGSIEIVDGKAPAEGDLLVEVSDLDSVHAQIKKNKIGDVTDIKPTHWKSRYFIFEHAATIRLAFWSFDTPPKLEFQTLEGDLHVAGARFAIVVSRFNQFITDRLLQGALDALHRTGSKDADLEVVRVPGAFEVPIAARKLALTKRFDAVVCLGLLMRGETSNYEHISDEVARGIGQAAQDSGVPCAYGVLTCDTLEQAIDRAGLKSGNKGFEAAISAVEMVSLARKLKNKKSSSKKSARSRKK